MKNEELWGGWIEALEQPGARGQIHGVGPVTRVEQFKGNWAHAGPHVCFLVVDGILEIRWKVLETDDETVEVLGVDDFCWIAPGVHFRMYRGGEGDGVSFRGIGFDAFVGEASVAPPRPFAVLRRTRRMARWWDAMAHELWVEHAAETPLVRSLLRHLGEICNAEMRQRTEMIGGLSVLRRRKIETAVKRALPRRLRPHELSDLVGLNHVYFSQKFKKTFGLAPKQWLVREHIHAAARVLVEGNDTISQVADRFGFCDIYHFSRQFKQIVGESPRQFRERGFF